MNTTIEEIYYNFCNDIKPSEEYWKTHNKVVKVLDNIAEKLPSKSKDILDKLYLLSGGLEAEQAKTYFIDGFKMGMRTAIETLKN